MVVNMKGQVKNEKGTASIESVVMMIVFLVLITYGIGVFGVVHTGILNSIAARTYAWETFNHRTNVQLFRDNRPADELGEVKTYVRYAFRVHTISSEDTNDDKYRATERTLAMGRDVDVMSSRNPGIHASLRATVPASRREQTGVNPVWIKTQYGICIDATCGGINL
jgi:hypothetical protein